MKRNPFSQLVLMALLVIGGLVLSAQQAAAQVTIAGFGRSGGVAVTLGGGYYSSPGYLQSQQRYLQSQQLRGNRGFPGGHPGGVPYSPGGTGHVRTGYYGTGFAGPGYIGGLNRGNIGFGRGFSPGGTGHIRARSSGTGRFRAF